MTSTWPSSLGIAFLFPLAILAGCNEQKVVQQEVVRPVKVVQVAAPDEGRKLQYSGTVKARQEMPLSFRVDGKLIERKVDVGQRVHPGDVLARLDPTDYQLAVKQSEAQLASAEKQTEISRLALKRSEMLQEKNVASQSALEQSQLVYDQAVSSRDAAVSALQLARNKVAYADLTSEANGIVTAVNAEAGQVVAAGASVVTVAADGEKEIEVAVPEVDVAEFSPGKQVTATFWSNRGLTLDGKVREIAGRADAQSRTFTVKVGLPDDGRVRLGMTATVTAKTGQTARAFVLPLAALAERDGKPVVWTVDKDKQTVSAHPVTVDGFADDGVRISSGIAAGDLIVAAGTQFMKDDMKVRLPQAAAQNVDETKPSTAPARS